MPFKKLDLPILMFSNSPEYTISLGAPFKTHMQGSALPFQLLYYQSFRIFIPGTPASPFLSSTPVRSVLLFSLFTLIPFFKTAWQILTEKHISGTSSLLYSTTTNQHISE